MNIAKFYIGNRHSFIKMPQKIKEDILDILTEALIILHVKDEGDVYKLKELSDQSIHNASVFQDEDSISIAVIIYSIYKIIERYGLRTHIYDVIKAHLKRAKRALAQGNLRSYRKIIGDTFHFISITDKRLKQFVEEVIFKAKITKGTKVFEHGISTTKAASLMDISDWELMNYIGKTNICLLYTSPSPRDLSTSRMPSSA